MRSIRVAVWGLGRHAVANILPAVAAAEGLELYGVCTRNAEVIADCLRARTCRGWTQPAEMLQDPAVDAIYVATPTGLHAAHGRQVLDAGKHLWCEKPLTIFLDETLDLVERARRRQASLCEGFMYLHHPQFERLCGYLSEGTLGAIRSVTCRFGIPKLERPGFRDDPAMGGGALLDVGCYAVSAIHALFPGEDVRIAYAAMEARGRPGVDTDGEAIVALSGGAQAYLEWRTGSAYRNEIDLWGETGSVSTYRIFSKPADYVPQFQKRDAHGTQTTAEGSAADHFVRMLRAFRDTIDDPAAAEDERRRIVRRAQTMHMIRTTAGAGRRIDPPLF